MRKRFLVKILVIIIITFPAVTISAFVIFDKSFTYQLELYSKKAAVNAINKNVNSIILEELSKDGLNYDNIIRVEKNNDGNTSFVKADMIAVNKIKNKLDLRIASLCECDDIFVTKIPIGNLFGHGLLHGKGFDIKVRFRPIGDSSTKMTGALIDSGINQTIYRISFKTQINIAIVFPFKYIETPVIFETVICETVIVGDVPEAFTYFNMEGDITSDEFQGYIEDFRAKK